MRYKTLFRVILKLLGVWLAANGVVSLTSTVSSMVRATWFTPGSVTYTYAYWLSLPSGIVGVAMGLYLFFRGKWIVDLAIPGNRPYCHECGYDLTGAAGHVCNECGTPFRAAAAAAAAPAPPLAAAPPAPAPAPPLAPARAPEVTATHE